MNDCYHIADKNVRNLQIFKAIGRFSTTLGLWQVWEKPRGVTMVSMLCIGSGASGAGGNTRASLGATVSAGGGSGGCSGYTKLLIPAALLPDRLYVSVGVGPVGGNASAAGVIGMNSYISAVQGSIVAGALYLSANTNNPAAPAAATTTGAAGAAGTIAAQTGMTLSASGIWSAIVSIAGVAGSVGAAAGSSPTPMTGSMLCGGTGGGGALTGANTATDGGAIAATALIPAIIGGPSGANPASNGMPGFFDINGIRGCGGTGGGSLGGTTGVGGNGGKGGIGCGGGGGGQGVTGGKGGDGGDGLVVIVSW